MITFEGNPIVDLVTEALKYVPLDGFAAAVVLAVAADDNFSTEQKLAVRIETDRLVRSGGTVPQLLEAVMNDGWSMDLPIEPLSNGQRETIIEVVIDHAKGVLTDRIAVLSALAEATYTIPQEEPSE